MTDGRRARWAARVALAVVTASALSAPGVAPAVEGGVVAGVDQVYRARALAQGTPTPPPPAPTALRFCDEPGAPADCHPGERLRLQVVSVGKDAAEPTVGVDPKGRAFYAAAAYEPVPRTTVLRSTDDGRTWTPTSPHLPVAGPYDPPATLDPMLHVDEVTGRVFNADNYAGCLWISFSDDAGETWERNPVACDRPVLDHQSLATAPFPAALASQRGAYPNVVWYCVGMLLHVAAICHRSLDGGRTWALTSEPAFPGFDPAGGGLCNMYTGPIRADEQGTLYVPKGHCGQPWLAVSSDGGDTWRRTRVSDQLPQAYDHTGVAVDDAGNVYYVWMDQQHRLPWMAVSRDGGATFGQPLMIAPPGVAEVNFPAVVAGEAGRVAVSFPATTVADRNSQDRVWLNYTLVTTDALATEPLFVSTTASPADDPVRRGVCGPGRCSGLFDFQGMVIAPHDGSLWEAIGDNCTTAACRTNSTWIVETNTAEGFAVRQVGGPRLRAVTAGP